MPFKKVGSNDFVSPSGRHFNGAQVRLWHANGNKFPGQAHSEGTMSYAKGGDVRPASYAKGGAVLGRTRDFLKSPDEFRNADGASGADEDDKYGKSGEGAGTGVTKPPKAPKDKSLKAVKAR